MKRPVLKAICCYFAGPLFLLMPPLAGAAYELAVAVGFVWWFLLRPEERAQRMDLGLRPVRSGGGWVAVAAVAYLVCSIALVNAIGHLAPGSMHQSWDLWTNYLARPYGAVPVVSTVAVAGPIIEEYLFRGWLQRWAIRRLGNAPGIVVTAVAFAVAHLSRLAVLPLQFLFGLAAGVLAHRTRSLWPGMAIHMCNNGIAILLFLSSRGPNGASADSPLPFAVFVAATLAGGLAFVAALSRIRPTPDPAPSPVSGASPALR